MRLLIDTNILINLEDNKIIDDDFSQFYRLAISNHCKVLYLREAITNDIGRDKNFERRNITMSKLKKYEHLSNYTKPTAKFYNFIRNKNINDEVDSLQLFQLYKGYVDFFITEDIGIHSNAKKIGLNKKVLNIKQARQLLEQQFTIIIPQHPILKEHSIRNIENKFKSSFFDSLRNDYGKVEFNKWLDKCAQEDRKCYSLIVDNDIQALLIYNIENVEDHKLKNIYEKALKICTLKVSDSAFGVKLGELFLQKMFELCIEQQINYLYLTAYEKQRHLIELLLSFGFYRINFTNKQGLSEIKLIKCLNKDNIGKSSSQNSRNIHPYYFDNSQIRKFAIPIQPEYYSTLFKDGKLREPTLFDETEESIKEIQGNTIIKAYISSSRIKNLNKGDLLFFYASIKRQVIEPVGILESIKIINDYDELLETVHGKTVFSSDQLKEFIEKKGTLNVITFRLITYLRNQIGLTKIQNLESFKNNIQTITKILESDYIKLKKDGHFDERYIIN